MQINQNFYIAFFATRNMPRNLKNGTLGKNKLTSFDSLKIHNFNFKHFHPEKNNIEVSFYT